MKRLFTILGVLIWVGAMTVPVLARGPGQGRGRHMGYWGDGPRYCLDYARGTDNLTDEQRTQLDKLSRKFYDETAKLRNEIWAKSIELNGAEDKEDLRCLFRYQNLWDH